MAMITNPKSWNDQPAIAEGASIVLRFHTDGIMYEVRKLDGGAYLLTGGTLFKSQSVKCSGADVVLTALNHAIHGKIDTTNMPAGCEVVS